MSRHVKHKKIISRIGDRHDDKVEKWEEEGQNKWWWKWMKTSESDWSVFSDRLTIEKSIAMMMGANGTAYNIMTTPTIGEKEWKSRKITENRKRQIANNRQAEMKGHIWNDCFRSETLNLSPYRPREKSTKAEKWAQGSESRWTERCASDRWAKFWLN
jgi:hypothetical protein